MARFIHAEFPTEHAGVTRFVNAAHSAQATYRNFNGARGAATLLLAALVSALLVVANEVVETWTEGHLLAAWIVMWLVGFAALALFAAPMRRAVESLRETFAAWGAARRQAAEDDKLWSIALTDARVMADLSRAMSRDAMRDVRGYF